jgi:hypothetical protein
MGDPNALVVLTVADGVVRGEMVWWWENESGKWRRSIRRLVSREYSCTKPQRAGKVGWCREVFAVPPRWDELLRTLQGQGIDALPDQVDLPSWSPSVFDGYSLTVEILYANEVVRYHYSNPDKYPQPECGQAAAIVDAVWAMYRVSTRAKSQ